MKRLGKRDVEKFKAQLAVEKEVSDAHSWTSKETGAVQDFGSTEIQKLYK